MKEISRFAALFVIPITMGMSMPASAQANPLCASLEERQSVQSALIASPKKTTSPSRPPTWP